MTRILIIPFYLILAACSGLPEPEANRRAAPELQLPPMKTFSNTRAEQPRRSNASIGADILDLAFALEGGAKLPVLTRFEGPITVRVGGPAPAQLSADLDRLIARLRNEAGIEITRVPAHFPASITIEVVDRRTLKSVFPEAACFVVPRMSSWQEYRANRGTAAVKWTTLLQRERAAIFLPGDESPQEMRDCLHEELAQAIGPLNDLYRLSDSVFNDDNFHSVLTGFDMLVLKAIYSPGLRSGMSREEVARRLPAILDRLNPSGRTRTNDTLAKTPRSWINAIETSLSPRKRDRDRRAAARRAVEIARAEEWQDTRAALSHYMLGQLSISNEPVLAISSFLEASSLYQMSSETELQAAEVSMQFAALALSGGRPEVALDIINDGLGPVTLAEDASLLATFLMVKAEALTMLGRTSEAEVVRQDALGWARYGFRTDEEVRARLAEIALIGQRDRREGDDS